jgi:NAD(P)-dependent dehydrogenase (short-subunit alcohol dehydrogenase family)
MNTTQTISGKIAIITGGGSGIGQGIALAFARAGVNVVICGRRAEALERTVQLAAGLPGQVIPVRGDVSVPEDVQRVVNETLSRLRQIDILVNNAAIFLDGSVHSLDIKTWEKVMAINLRGPFLICRAVIPHMRERQSGHIINISSESGIEYYSGDAAYGTSKHALNALAEYIQLENQDLNIRVDTICPGMVVTEMTANDAGLNHKKCLYPEDIADLALWLVTRRQNVKIGTPILIQTMENPWGR